MTILTHPVFRPLLCLCVVAIWAVNFVAIDFLVEQLAPQTAVSARFIFTSLFYLPFMRWPGWEKAKIIFLISLGLCSLHQGFLFASYSYLQTGTIAVMLQTQVVFAVLMGAFFFKEKIGWRMVAGIILSFIGLIVIFGAPQAGESAIGFVFALLSALTLAYSYMKMKNLENIHAPTFLCLINGMAVPFVVAFALIFESNHIDIIKGANWTIILPILLFQAVFVSGCHATWQRLLSVNPVSAIVPFTLLLPVFGVTASVILLDEIVTPSLLIGGGITLLGVSVITLRQIKKNKSVPIKGLE